VSGNHSRGAKDTLVYDALSLHTQNFLYLNDVFLNVAGCLFGFYQ
jgi:hypothetical protein